VRRRYEWLRAFPQGLLVLGDAFSSVNPVYGQGMSSAALQALALRRLLRQRVASRHGLHGIAAPFFETAAAVVETPWSLAAASDFLYPQTRGRRPRAMSLRARYVDALNALSGEDPAVNQAMTEVFHLARPLDVLLRGALARRAWLRVLAHALRAPA
jgi:2-polyprenyl-6-methoxyphenol hydroxylase-like FAD-dependent oxidoreductase